MVNTVKIDVIDRYTIGNLGFHWLLSLQVVVGKRAGRKKGRVGRVQKRAGRTLLHSQPVNTMYQERWANAREKQNANS
jgi:hypothetical protein